MGTHRAPSAKNRASACGNPLPPWHTAWLRLGSKGSLMVRNGSVRACLAAAHGLDFHKLYLYSCGPSHLDAEFPGGPSATPHTRAVLLSITETDGACSRTGLPAASGTPSGSQQEIAISFAWSCRKEEARTELQTKGNFQIKEERR